MEDLPKLEIHPDGNSGVEIRAVMEKKYNCVEFTMRDDKAQIIFISPWIQFEPKEWVDDRIALATEIIRRANAYKSIVEKYESEKKNTEEWMDRYSEMETTMITHACIAAEILSRTTDPVVKRFGENLSRNLHRRELMKQFTGGDIVKYTQWVQDHTTELLEKGEYSRAPAQSNREQYLGLKQENGRAENSGG